MTKKELEKILTNRLMIAVISAADYDLGKCFDPETSEDPDDIQENLERIKSEIISNWEE